jgi:hypothetical protein
LTVFEINTFVQVDKLNILIVEAINESAYGFNLSNEAEKATAIQVVTDKDNFTVVGWSISKIIPNWVKSFDEWNIYISDQGRNCGDSNIVNHQKLRNEDGLEQHVEAGEKDLFDNLADEIKVTNGKVNHNPYLKVQNERSKSSIVKTKFDGNSDMFDMCGDDLKKEVSTYITKKTTQNQLKLMFVDLS